MDGPRDNHIKSEKDKYHDITYVCNIKKNDTNELKKQKQTHRHRKQIYGYQRGSEGAGDKLGVWD